MSGPRRWGGHGGDYGDRGTGLQRHVNHCHCSCTSPAAASSAASSSPPPPLPSYDDPRAARLVGRLDALLSVMSYCKGERCRTAYGAAVRDDSVTSLAQLMDPQYDALIARLPRFKILRCSPAYLPSNEESWYRGSD